MKNSQKSLIVLTVVTLIVLITAGGTYFVQNKDTQSITKRENAAVSTQPGWKVYENKDMKFMISYPEGWTIRDMSKEFGIINLWINGPLRTDMKSHVGLPVSYYFTLTQGTGDLQPDFGDGCFSTPDPAYRTGQTACNAPVQQDEENSAPEKTMARQIFNTFEYNGVSFLKLPPTIRLLDPNGGNIWSINSDSNNIVSWTYVSLPETMNVQLSLRSIKDASDVCHFDFKLPISQMVFTLYKDYLVCQGKTSSLPTDRYRLLPGIYKLEIGVVDYGGKGLMDSSDNYFTVTN